MAALTRHSLDEIRKFVNDNYGPITDEVKEKSKYYVGDKVWFFDFCGIAIKSEIVAVDNSDRYWLDEPYLGPIRDYSFSTKERSLFKLSMTFPHLDTPDTFEEWRTIQINAITNKAAIDEKMTNEEVASFQAFLINKFNKIKIHRKDYFLASDFKEMKK